MYYHAYPVKESSRWSPIYLSRASSLFPSLWPWLPLCPTNSVCLWAAVRITFPSVEEWGVKSNLRNARPADMELWRMQLCLWQIISDLIPCCSGWQPATAIVLFCSCGMWNVKTFSKGVSDIADFSIFLCFPLQFCSVETKMRMKMYELHTFYFSSTLYLCFFRYSSQGWSLDQITIFALVDSFVRRCKDLIEVSKYYKMMQTNTHSQTVHFPNACRIFYTLLSQENTWRISSQISQ